MPVGYLLTGGLCYGEPGSGSNPYWEILEAVAELLENVGGCPTPEVRELAYAVASDTTPPFCWVCPVDSGEKIKKHTFRETFWDYPVLVLLIFSGNRNVGRVALESRLQIRHDVGHALFTTVLDGTSAVMDCDPSPRAAVDVQQALGSHYVVTGHQLTYRVPRVRAQKEA